MPTLDFESQVPPLPTQMASPLQINSLLTPLLMMTPLMPIQGECCTPIFDTNQPSEIQRFFDQLETLFTQSNIINAGKKKVYTICYANYSTAKLWEAIPEY